LHVDNRADVFKSGTFQETFVPFISTDVE